MDKRPLNAIRERYEQAIASSTMTGVPDGHVRQDVLDIGTLLMIIEVLETGINTILDDEDADAGWGPDITHVDMLRKLVGREPKYGGHYAR